MLKGWFRSGWKCNGLFWVIVFLLLVFSDIYVLFGVETDNAVELIGSSLGRLATQAASVLCLLFVFKFVLGMTPKPLRAIVILVFSLSPILVVTDFLLKQYWNHSLFTFVNSLTASGSFDLSKEIAASGIGHDCESIFRYCVAGTDRFLFALSWHVSYKISYIESFHSEWGLILLDFYCGRVLG